MKIDQYLYHLVSDAVRPVAGCGLKGKGTATILAAAGALFLLLSVTAPVAADPPDIPRPTPSEGMPTPERLAPPPTVENPTQADEGAQLFWLHCQPCHGDHGQGLTDEWRSQYPPEHQNCWEAGCHGDRPYEQGFTLPRQVPAVIGGESLDRFETMGQVYQFIRASMPLQEPGALEQGDYLAIAAYLARAHDLWEGRPVNEETLSALRLKPPPATAAAPVHEDRQPTSNRATLYLLLLVPFALGGYYLWTRR